jgi:hypothetical protein
MEQYQIDIIKTAFNRCYGLQSMVERVEPNDKMFDITVEVLANQTGMIVSFIKANINQIKEFKTV